MVPTIWPHGLSPGYVAPHMAGARRLQAMCIYEHLLALLVTIVRHVLQRHSICRELLLGRSFEDQAA